MDRKNGKAGRPPFAPTGALRKKVEGYVGSRMSHRAIAHALGIDRATLEKHFREELDGGAAILKATAIDCLVASAKAGNVSAQKKLYDIADASLAAMEVEKFGLEDKPAKAVPVRLQPGKKETAIAAAKAAMEDPDSEWGTDLKFQGGRTMN